MRSPESETGRELVGRYRLDEVIGAGGMGRVWRGTDLLLDRPVAVKELTTPPNLPEREVEVLRTRMLREARSAAQLSHPSIITVFDVVEVDGRPWIVMELVRGPSLGDLVRQEERLSVRRTADIGEQMCAGLSEAHGRGIVHRDIKPGNVLIAGNDRAVVTDFGIAHVDGSTHLTSTGLLIGSPRYLAPEVAEGYPATAASDAWALGVTLYQSVEGSLPFDRPTPMGTLTAIVTQDLPESVHAGALRPILEGLCEKRAENRPSIGEVRTRLRELRDADAPTAVVPAPAPDPAPATEVFEAPEEPETAAHGTTSETFAEPAPAEPEPVAAVAESAPAEPASEADETPVVPWSDRGEEPAPGNAARRLLVAAAVLVVLAATATAVYMVSANRPGDGAAADLVEGSVEGSQPVAGSASDAPPPEEPATDTPPPPEETDEWDFLVRHEDPSGFAVDVPEDWTEERDGHMVYFRGPDGAYLLVDQGDDPGPDAAADWRDYEPQARGSFGGGYELIGIEEIRGGWADDYLTAADWEFTFTSGGREMHAINRGFHTETKGYALFLVTPDDPGANHALIDRMARTFEPAS
ncbi:serine/threonine-protein kinase [Nocardiopsis sp. LOL_012]|uniref:serine/threonine-protein kinase n=1 Tax=Nocardiopsis sp. LOL_012 TaxID=3345409 RepID=UPI003A8638FB